MEDTFFFCPSTTRTSAYGCNHIPCITQVTFKMIYNTLLVNHSGLGFLHLDILVWRLTNTGCTAVWTFELRLLRHCLTILADSWSLKGRMTLMVLSCGGERCCSSDIVEAMNCLIAVVIKTLLSSDRIILWKATNVTIVSTRLEQAL